MKDSLPILTVEIRLEHDIVLARQRARQIAALLGFDRQDEVRIATAVSEIARNAYQYGRKGKVEFAVTEGRTPAFTIRVSDRGKGIEKLQDILGGRYSSRTGMGLGIVGARRLMDEFKIDSPPREGVTVVMRKYLPPGHPALTKQSIAHLTGQLSEHAPQNPFEEMQRQNQELIATLEELQRRTEELAQLNRELEDTNRGVVALYAELDEKAEHLRRASELKTRFLSNMTHEFRTPLNSILSLTGMLLDRIDGPLGQEQEKQVSYVKKAAQDLSELVDDLLDIAKVEAGKVEVRVSTFEIPELFRALRGMLRPLLVQDCPVKLVIEKPEGTPTMHTDKSKVSQILRNLISNALKYTERGEVKVSARMNRENTITLSVEDTGIGIAPEDQQRIFEEFVQVEGPHQTRVKGTGLGLPLSGKLAELLGGEISCRSTLGVGSVFEVTLPVTYPGTRVASPEMRAGPGPDRRRRGGDDNGELKHPPAPRKKQPRQQVLLVDDDEVSRYVLRGLLAETRYSVAEASGGKTGLEMARQLRPSAIILDLAMPDLSGYEVLDRLKADPLTQEIPVIIMTSALLTEDEKKRLSPAAVAILSKDHAAREASLDSLRDALVTAGLTNPKSHHQNEQ